MFGAGQQPGRPPPTIIFDDFTRLVEATMERLPEHLKAIVQTGQPASDPPETTELFAQVRARYDTHGQERVDKIFTEFSRAFALLLEAAAPGPWHYATLDSGYMGPDILGDVFMQYTNPNPAYNSGTFLTPWPVALASAKITIGDGPAQIHQRLKEALTHPDNILGQAVLLASLVIDDPQQAGDWFFNRVLPAAIPFYESLKICDPAVGSGVMRECCINSEKRAKAAR